MTLKDRPNFEPDVAYSYDLRNLQTGATFTSTGQGVTNQYDAFGRLTSTTTNVGGVSRTLSFAYDPNGNRTRVTHPDGIWFDYDRDPAGRVTRIRENGATSGIGVLATYAYQQGRRMSVTRSNGTVTSYAYDGASRLTQLTQDLGGGTAHDLDLTFAYNPASQIRENVRSNDVYAFTGLGSGSTASTVNGLNQLTEVGGTALTHDARGNMTSDGTRTFGYSSENLMTSGGGYGLAYDPLMRLSQIEGSGTDRRFLYDGDRLALEYDGNGNLLRRFVHGPGVDEPLVWYEGSGTGDRRFLHADERGSIAALSNFWGDGLAYAINRYDEYGVPDTNNLGRFGYTGQVWLPELGLHHYKARMYNPRLGRFVQRDPIGYDDQVNLYAYVENDPVSFTDASGMTCTQSGQRDDGRPIYSCRIDKVLVRDRNGRWTTRLPTERENRMFSAFNRRYTNAVNRLASSPDRSVRVAPVQGDRGSFRITAGESAASLISRQFIYTGTAGPSGGGLATAGVYNPATRRVEGAMTFVGRSALTAIHEPGIVHDGGMHSTYQEWTGGLQDPSYPLGRIEHQRQYNEAACALLGEKDCEP